MTKISGIKNGYIHPLKVELTAIESIVPLNETDLKKGILNAGLRNTFITFLDTQLERLDLITDQNRAEEIPLLSGIKVMKEKLRQYFNVLLKDTGLDVGFEHQQAMDRLRDDPLIHELSIIHKNISKLPEFSPVKVHIIYIMQTMEIHRRKLFAVTR